MNKTKLLNITSEKGFKQTKKGLYWYLQTFTGVLNNLGYQNKQEKFLSLTWKDIEKLLANYK